MPLFDAVCRQRQPQKREAVRSRSQLQTGRFQLSTMTQRAAECQSHGWFCLLGQSMRHGAKLTGFEVKWTDIMGILTSRHTPMYSIPESCAVSTENP